MDDDEAYRKWLGGRLVDESEALRELKTELETVALELVGRRGPRVPPWSPSDAPVRLLVLAGAPPAILPALYGLKPSNECPDPVTHAAVLGRWAREHRAEVRFVGRDALSLAVDSPPDVARDIAWAALATYAYCPEPTLLECARLVRSPRWTFWLD